MKKSLVLSLVLVLILGTMAAAGSSLKNNGTETGNIAVTATVGPYAEIRGLVDSLELNFLGEAFEKGNGPRGNYKQDDFRVSSNTDVDVTFSWDRLTLEDWKINTFLTVWPREGYQGYAFSVMADETNPVQSRILKQGVEEHGYRVRVGGELGDIHDQSAGNYTMTVTVTVAASI